MNLIFLQVTINLKGKLKQKKNIKDTKYVFYIRDY
jgi:hypothetical protein